MGASSDTKKDSMELKKLKEVQKLPKGFMLSGIKANIKYKNRYDLALIYSKNPCIAVGVWTRNSMQAACILYNKSIINNPIHAVMINSGYANACTSIQGDKNCITCANLLAKNLQIDSNNILLASTGVIGQQLPMDRFIKAIPKLTDVKSNTKKSIKCASQAIMTTDTYPKVFGVKFNLLQTHTMQNPKNDADSTEAKDSDLKSQAKPQCKKHKIKVWGMAKGSGMIHPNMATMLGFIVTDISIERNLLQEALSEVVQQSFNQISVDGDTSTNDMVVVLANGEAKNQTITQKNEDYEIFKNALKNVCVNLAKKIAKDGEGATHFLEVVVKNAKSLEQAQKLSKVIVGSNLVKTAIFGKDANWGRIVCAMGYSETEFDISKVDLSFQSKNGKIAIIKNGMGLKFGEAKAKEILSASKIQVVINLKDGNHSAKAWGCDLGYNYIKINADYRS